MADTGHFEEFKAEPVSSLRERTAGAHRDCHRPGHRLGVRRHRNRRKHQRSRGVFVVRRGVVGGLSGNQARIAGVSVCLRRNRRLYRCRSHRTGPVPHRHVVRCAPVQRDREHDPGVLVAACILYGQFRGEEVRHRVVGKEGGGVARPVLERVGHRHGVRHRHRLPGSNRRGEGQEHLRTVQRNPGHRPGGAVDGDRERRRRRLRARVEGLVIGQRELKGGRRRAPEHGRGAGAGRGRARLVGRAAVALRVPGPDLEGVRRVVRQVRHGVAGRVHLARRALLDVLPGVEPSGRVLPVLVRGDRAPAVVSGRRPPQRHRPVARGRREARRRVRRRRAALDGDPHGVANGDQTPIPAVRSPFVTLVRNAPAGCRAWILIAGAGNIQQVRSAAGCRLLEHHEVVGFLREGRVGRRAEGVGCAAGERHRIAQHVEAAARSAGRAGRIDAHPGRTVAAEAVRGDIDGGKRVSVLGVARGELLPRAEIKAEAGHFVFANSAWRPAAGLTDIRHEGGDRLRRGGEGRTAEQRQRQQGPDGGPPPGMRRGARPAAGFLAGKRERRPGRGTGALGRESRREVPRCRGRAGAGGEPGREEASPRARGGLGSAVDLSRPEGRRPLNAGPHRSPTGRRRAPAPRAPALPRHRARPGDAHRCRHCPSRARARPSVPRPRPIRHVPSPASHSSGPGIRAALRGSAGPRCSSRANL